MDNGDSGSGALGDSFLTSGAQYIVHSEVDNDDNLGISGDSMDAADKDSEPLREQLSVTGPLSSFYNLPHRSVSHKKEDYQDRFLPIANVARIMKNAIPKTGKIAKDAKECVQECVSEFVSFITSEASDRCHQEKRKTINGEDILFAMSTLGFDNYVEPLKLYLQKYREAMKGEKNASTAIAADTSPENLEDGSFSTQTLTASMLSTDPAGQQNVIYTTTYPGQIHFA